jgi:peroxiredoxin
MRALSVLLGLFVASVPMLAAPPVPRQSPEFVINYPGGKQALLSNYKGKVVLLEFIFTTCPHCQVTSQMLSKVYKDLGPKGFQPLAVAVNPMSLMLVDDFVKQFSVNFPVGASEQGPALSYLQIGGADRWVVPQVVLIDQKGVIRAQTPPQGDQKLQDETYLRTEIQKLLQSGATAKTAPKPPAAKKST